MKKNLLIVFAVLLISITALNAESNIQVGINTASLEIGSISDFDFDFDFDTSMILGISTSYENGIFQADARTFTTIDGYSDFLNQTLVESTVGVQVPLDIVDIGFSVGTIYRINQINFEYFMMGSNLDINVDPLVIKLNLSTGTLMDSNFIFKNPLTEYLLTSLSVSCLYKL